MSADVRLPILVTLILDSGVLPARRRAKSLVGTTVGFISGLVGGFILTKSVEQANRAGSGLGPLTFIAAFILAITIHELGHLVAGWAVGFHFSFVYIGPFSLRLEHGALKIRIRREMPALGYAGMHADRVRRLRRRMLIYIAAGPAANLMSVPLTMLLVNTAFPGLGETWPGSLAGQFGVLSLLLGVINLIPFGSRPISDGARIAMLLSSRERARRWISSMAIGTQGRNGVRPRYWRKTWLKAASSLRDTSVDEFSGNWSAYVAANDRKDELAASAHLERCLELSSLLRPSVRDIVAQEAAVFSAWFRGNAPLAEKWVSQVKKPKLMQRLLRIRLAVALPCGRHDFDAAIARWQEGAAFIDKLPATVQSERLKESWLEWRSEIEERRSRLFAV